MQQVFPTLRITDCARSRKFYVEGLGFRVDWEHRIDARDPVFMQVTRDGLSLYLSEHSADGQTGGLVHLYVPNVDAWYEDLARRGVVSVAFAPRDEAWGNRDMRILDPDGNQICVCTPIRRRP
jgi:catechol 2,3-dioxygenase-like lactoylglutathione lyase family enzyme